MATDIEVTALTGNASAGQIAWIATAPPPAGFADLSYMRAAKIEVWTSTTNNRANATKLGESDIGLVIQAGLAANTTRYAWARAVDEAGNVSDWFPASATGGRVATTLSTAPGPNSVGTDELKDDAVTPQKMSVTQLSAITANMGTVIGGTFRTAGSGARVEMSSSGSYPARFVVFNSSGQRVAELGALGTAPLIVDSSSLAGAITGSFSGSLLPVFFITNESAGVALWGRSMAAGSNAHGIRGAGGPESSGGRGLVGVASASGGYAFYAERGPYGPFTGSHDAFIQKGNPVDVGDIVRVERVMIKSSETINDAIPEVKRSSAAKDKAVFGVVSLRQSFDRAAILGGLPLDLAAADSTDPLINSTPMRRLLEKSYDRCVVNAIGEGLMNVCGRGGNIEIGDYICTSTMPGKGMRQTSSLTLVGATIVSVADDTLRNFTVAKAMEAVTFASPDEVKLIACTYHCG
jgi:hypothetical protein